MTTLREYAQLRTAAHRSLCERP